MDRRRKIENTDILHGLSSRQSLKRKRARPTNLSSRTTIECFAGIDGGIYGEAPDQAISYLFRGAARRQGRQDRFDGTPRRAFPTDRTSAVGACMRARRRLLM